MFPLINGSIWVQEINQLYCPSSCTLIMLCSIPDDLTFWPNNPPCTPSQLHIDGLNTTFSSLPPGSQVSTLWPVRRCSLDNTELHVSFPCYSLFYIFNNPESIANFATEYNKSRNSWSSWFDNPFPVSFKTVLHLSIDNIAADRYFSSCSLCCHSLDVHIIVVSFLNAEAGTSLACAFIYYILKKTKWMTIQTSFLHI